MKEADVGNALRRLPRATASPRFTSDVVHALPEEPPPRPAWRLVTAMAITLVLVAGTYAASVHRARQHRLETLRAEQQQIKSELRQVKAMADEVQPVVVLEL